MGGRGASSGTSKAGNAYGTQYRQLLKSGNIVFVQKTSAQSETLMETMTDGRVYVQVDAAGALKSVVYFDKGNKRAKQIDLKDHRGVAPHVHHGYLHNEYSPSGAPTKATPKERKMVERAQRLWDNHVGKQ